jgi:hypothetical protein
MMFQLLIKLKNTILFYFVVRKHCYNDLGKRCVIKTDSQDVFNKYIGVRR